MNKNKQTNMNRPLSTVEMKSNEALKNSEIVSLFGEKYAEHVRVVKVKQTWIKENKQREQTNMNKGENKQTKHTIKT